MPRKRYYRARRSRRSKKTSINSSILIAATAIALAASLTYGQAANTYLALATMIIIGAGIILAAALGWLIYRRITSTIKYNQAVHYRVGKNMTWQDFELLVMDLLKTQGFKIKAHPSGAGDHGADVIASKGNDTYSVQVKFYSAKLDNSSVQEVVAAKAFYKCNKSMVVTNSHFTVGAKVLAASNDCILIDRERLGEWILNSSSTD